MIQLLYGSLTGYIQLSVTAVNATVNLAGTAVLCVPVAVWFSRIHPTVCNSNDGTLKTYLVVLYSVIQLLYGSLGYIQLLVTAMMVQ